MNAIHLVSASRHPWPAEPSLDVLEVVFGEADQRLTIRTTPAPAGLIPDGYTPRLSPRQGHRACSKSEEGVKAAGLEPRGHLKPRGLRRQSASAGGEAVGSAGQPAYGSKR